MENVSLTLVWITKIGKFDLAKKVGKNKTSDGKTWEHVGKQM